MLSSGMPPFYSRDRDRLFEKILHSKLRFPNYFSDAAVNILTLLMQVFRGDIIPNLIFCEYVATLSFSDNDYEPITD